MKLYKVVISKEAPALRDALWAKPVSGGFVLYLLDNGKWNPLKVVDDAGTSSLADDTIQNLIGSVQDEPTANTINGAKALANSIVGTSDDTAEDLTLNGLKKYIDAAIQNLG